MIYRGRLLGVNITMKLYDLISKKLSLQNGKRSYHYITKSVMNNPQKKQILKKQNFTPRAFPCTLSGSLTVETALVLPIFMFMIISLISFCQVMEYSDTVLTGMHQSVRELAVKAYVKSAVGLDAIEGGRLAGVVLSEGYVSGKVSFRLDQKGFNKGSISYLRSNIGGGDVIDIIAVEEVPLLYGFLGVKSLRVMDRARVHAFTGYDNTRSSDSTLAEETVYITASGSVYHRSRSCGHLNIRISQISAAQLEDARSSAGARYYQCEYCKGRSGAEIYYITDYGNRYHTKISCQGLKRDIITVPLSKVSGMSPCKSCGGG